MTRYLLCLIGLCATLALIIWATAARSHATDFHPYYQHGGYQQPKKSRRYRRKPRPQVRYYAPPVIDEEAEKFCLGPVRGVGKQWIGEEGALDAAKDDWMARVRYDLGESFLDMKNAEDFRKRCGRTSVGETLGQVFHRCEIVARPCKSTFTQGATK